MSAGLTILLVVAAWALGPLILRCAGGLMTTTAVLLWAIPMETHTTATALIVTAVSGAAMWHTGTTWQARRHAARSASRNAPPGRELIGDGIALLRRWRNTRDTYEQGGEPYPINGWDPGNTPHRELWDEDVIDSVADDVEPGRRGNTRGARACPRRHTGQMVTVTRKIRRPRLVPTMRTLTSWVHLRRCPNEPAEGWFTIQSEPSEGMDRDLAVPAKLRSERTGRGQQHARALPAVRSPPTVRHERVRRVLSVVVARHRRLLVAIAVTGALAAGAMAAALGSHNTRHSALIVAQRATIAQLAAQRDQALAAARQAQSSQVAWRAQAIRWRSRARANRRSPRRRSARGRQRSRPGRRRN